MENKIEVNKHQVKTGESLWLIEQTDQVGIRKFWAGDLWTDNVMEAVRFPSHSAASVLACHYAWSNFGNPPRKNELVDICEHLFQCGIEDSDVSDFEQQRDSALKLLNKWKHIVEVLAIKTLNCTESPDNHIRDFQAYDACADELRTIFSHKEGK